MRNALLIAGCLLIASCSDSKIEAQTVAGNCGLQLGGAVTFCDTFDTKNPGIPSRTGDLDPNVWGVSRAAGNNHWGATQIIGCSGSPTVSPPNDIAICNGQLRQASNDNHDVTVLAMYPKQPFDFAGRTGTVAFDVSNDTQGSHAAWPEFWITDTPVPTPFSHFNSWISFPKNGFGIRFALNAEIGQYGNCPPNGTNMDKRRFSVDSAVVIRNYAYEDTNGFAYPAGTVGVKVNILDCVAMSPGPNGPLNHMEIKVAQNLIEVWAADAGVPTSLRKIATMTNPNLSFSRGLVWLQDAHYNASKGACPPQTNVNPVCQDEHTFTWDNLAFDGPFTYRDFSYDALDNSTTPDANGLMDLFKTAQPNQLTSWNVLNMPANPQATAVRVLFNWRTYFSGVPNNIVVKVNGHGHTIPYPYPANDTYNPSDGTSFGSAAWRTFPLTIPITELVAGTNVVEIGTDIQNDNTLVSNVNIVLVEVPGGVPILPGSNNAYPGATTPPPSGWTNVTGNLAGMASECGQTPLISASPNSGAIIGGVAQHGLWQSTTDGVWSQLGSGAGSDVITNRSMWITYDPLNSNSFWEAGIYNGSGAYKTTNGGSTFQHLGSVTHNDFISVDYADPNRQTILVGGHEQKQSVWKSTDGGNTWVNIGLNLPAGTGFSTSPLIINSQTFLVNSWFSWGGGTSGIYRTTNGGATWTLVSNVNPVQGPLVASNGTIYWATAAGQLAKSTDAGVTWTSVGSGLQGVRPTQLPDGRIVAVGGSTLVASSDAGITWSALGTALPYSPMSLTYSSARQGAYISHNDCGTAVLPDAFMRLAVASTTPPPTVVNGSCGSANGVPVSSAPTANLCTAGTVSAVAGTGPWTWSCNGSNGGTNASCSAPLAVTPSPTAALAANPASIISGQTSTLSWSSTNATSCTASGGWTGTKAISGTLAVSPPSTTTYTLACTGAGGTSPMASTMVTVRPAAINGVCGSANGSSVTTQPTTNLCSTGAIMGPWAWSGGGPAGGAIKGPFTWTCNGSNGGIAANCSASSK